MIARFKQRVCTHGGKDRRVEIVLADALTGACPKLPFGQKTRRQERLAIRGHNDDYHPEAAGHNAKDKLILA